MEKGSNNSIKFRSNADFAEFVKVTVDGKDLDLKHYTANSGSTVIELNTEYLKTLSVGEHKISIVSTNGHADTIFTIKIVLMVTLIMQMIRVNEKILIII